MTGNQNGMIGRNPLRNLLQMVTKRDDSREGKAIVPPAVFA